LGDSGNFLLQEKLEVWTPDISAKLEVWTPDISPKLEV